MDFKALVEKATEEANHAGKIWMDKATANGPAFVVRDGFTGRSVGTMLDCCGNAHLRVRDKRSKLYKGLKALGLVRGSGYAVVEIHHNYRMRQEWGLHEACIGAAKRVFNDAGFVKELDVWSYID